MTQVVSRFFFASSIAFGCLAILSPTTAQIVPDNTLPVNSSVTPGCTVCTIEGGTTRGVNLFHSFSDFSVPTGGEAFFNNATQIKNILTRVTGNSVSNIDGLIRANGTANLFFLNPNGIIFGANARLDVGGSFVATTANAIEFGTQGFFSASAPEAPALLTVNPSAFLFNQIAAQPQPIINQSVAPNRVNPATVDGLQVPQGRSLLLVGGDVRLNGGVLRAPGGRVELGGVAQNGTVGLNANGNELRLSFPSGVARADVSLTNASEVNVRAGGGGSIAINARNVDILQGSTVRTGIASGLGSPDSKAGDIEINATGITTVAGESLIANVVQSEGAGKGGDINITTGSLFVTDGGQVIASTFGQGNAGSVRIRATDTVSFDGVSSNGFSSSAFSDVAETAEGDGGDIEITTNSLLVTNGAQLIANTLGKGNAGSVRISATDTVRFDRGDALSSVEKDAVGDGGDIEITTNSLLVTNGAQLIANTFGKGNAGSVRIRATDTVSFDGVSSNGFSSAAFSNVEAKEAVGDGGDIEITTGSLSVTNGAGLFADTYGQGNAGSVRITADSVRFDGGQAFSNVRTGAVGDGGDIEINTGSLSVTNRAVLFATTFGKGNAGSVRIRATDTVRFDGSYAFSAVGSEAVGNSGDIEISTGSLSVTNGAGLSANTNGQGNAGTVRISASDTVRFDGSYAFSSVGKDAVGDGSDIVINTGTLEVTNGASLIAGTYGQGKAGSVRIRATDTVRFDGGGAASEVGIGAVGDGGDIEIITGSLEVADGAFLSAATGGQRNAGNIKITATDQVRFDGGSAASAVLPGAVGDGGDVEIATGSLEVTNGAFLLAGTGGQGNAGNIKITATDQVRFDGGSAASSVLPGVVGDGGDVEITTGSLEVTNGSFLSAATGGQGKAGSVRISATDTVSFDRGNAFTTVEAGAVGNGGDIEITTGSLEVTNGAQLSATTFGQGNAGDVKITATDKVRFAGVGSNGRFSGTFSAVGERAVGDGGDIEITTGSLSLTDAVISSVSVGTGTAGDITLQTRQNLEMNRGRILASTLAGDGGDMTLRVGDILLMRNGSKISTTAGEAGAGGNGGNINIDADFIVAIPKEDSDITANAFNGRGGNINITTQGIYGLEYRERLTLLSDITASSQFGLNGEFQLDLLTNVDPSRGLAELPTNVVDASEQIDRRCTPAGRTQERSSFTVTGRGGLPPSPTDPLINDAVSVDWITLEDKQGNGNSEATDTNPTSSNPKQLVEAQGWVIGSDGRVILTASAPNATPYTTWSTPANCQVSPTNANPNSR